MLRFWDIWRIKFNGKRFCDGGRVFGQLNQTGEGKITFKGYTFTFVSCTRNLRRFSLKDLISTFYKIKTFLLENFIFTFVSLLPLLCLHQN